MNTNEVLKLALGKIKSARDCHFAAIDTLLFEAEEILEEALAEQPAPMSQPNRVIAYSAATKLRELGYEWVDGAWKQPAQPQQEPVAWAIFTDAGNARMWSTFQPHLQKLADAEGLTITPLYTKDQI